MSSKLLVWILFKDIDDPTGFRWYCGWVYVIVFVLPALIAIWVTDIFRKNHG